MPAVHINDNQFEEQVLKSKTPVLVDFFAEWCGPCKMAAPILDKLSDEFAGKVSIVKIDVDQNQEYSNRFGVRGIPTVIAFKDGAEVDRKTGFIGESGYKAFVESLMK
jgi:thioredoxin 1